MANSQPGLPGSCSSKGGDEDSFPRITRHLFRVVDWPGVHSAKARLLGEPLTGHWFSRKDEHAARRRGKDFDPMEYATEETVVLSPIPCWEHLPAEEYRDRIRGLVEEVEEEAAADRERSGIPVLGPGAILAQDPQHRPKKLNRSPAPFVHAATKAARQALYQSYSWFVGEFRKAAWGFRANPARDSDGKAATDSETKAATDSDGKAATF